MNDQSADIGSFVDEAQSAIRKDVRIPPGSWLEWGGQFKTLSRRSAGLRWSFRL
jgi:cobalt-zinc-cadmium resistance protein CzcA